jgi:hypothetical protein
MRNHYPQTKKANFKLAFTMRKVITLCLILIFIFATCELHCDDPSNNNILSENYIVFTFINGVNGFNLYTEPSTNYYLIDSFNIRNDTNELIDFRKELGGNGDYLFEVQNVFNPDEDELPLLNDLCKTYFLYHRYNNADTLSICYTTKSNKCGSPTFNKIKALVNGVEVAAESNTPVIAFKIIK